MDSCTSSAVSWGNIPQFPAVCHTSLAAKVIVQRKELKYKGQATTFLSVHQIAPYLIVTAKNKTALWFHLTADLAPGKWHNQLLMPKHSEIYNQYSSLQNHTTKQVLQSTPPTMLKDTKEARSLLISTILDAAKKVIAFKRPHEQSWLSKCALGTIEAKLQNRSAGHLQCQSRMTDSYTFNHYQ